MSNSKNGEAKDTIAGLMAAFSSRDVDRIMDHFSEDAIYHNMPMKAVQDTEAIRSLVDYFVHPASEIEFEVLSIMAEGNTVLTERLDRFVINGKTVTLPVMGSFEVSEGKITAWRDYFDMATWQNQTG